jgi:hypothetical protein
MSASPPRRGRRASRRSAPFVLGLALVLGACRAEPPEPPEPRPAPATAGHGPVFVFLDPGPRGPSQADVLLHELLHALALEAYAAEPHSVRRSLGLGQAHLGLGRFYADLHPLSLRLTRDVLELTAGERPLDEGERLALGYCRAPEAWPPGGVPELGRLLELRRMAPAELLAALGPAGLLAEARTAPDVDVPHPAGLRILAELHLRLAEALLEPLGAEADFGAAAGALAAEARAVREALGGPPRPGAGSGAGRQCVAETWELALSAPAAQALSRLGVCAGTGETAELARRDPAWLLVRALVYYREGSCSGYALAAVDLAALEAAFPAVPVAARLLRRLYAEECAAGGRVTGG